MKTSFPPPASTMRPATLRLTVPAPGDPPREALVAIVLAAVALVLVGAAATLGLGDEVPGGRRYADVAFNLASHKLIIVASSGAALSATVLGIAGWKRSRLIAGIAIAGSLTWAAVIGWAMWIGR